MKNKLKLFKRLETLKKKDILKDQQNFNAISKEISKTKNLIEKIDLIISENIQQEKTQHISAAIFKNQSNLLSTLNEQKYIAKNKKEFLLKQCQFYSQSIGKKNNDKKIINKKYKEQLQTFLEELENKNLINYKKK